MKFVFDRTWFESFSNAWREFSANRRARRIAALQEQLSRVCQCSEVAINQAEGARALLQLPGLSEISTPREVLRNLKALKRYAKKSADRATKVFEALAVNRMDLRQFGIPELCRVEEARINAYQAQATYCGLIKQTMGPQANDEIDAEIDALHKQIKRTMTSLVMLQRSQRQTVINQ